jgi:hypothetical protein
MSEIVNGEIKGTLVNGVRAPSLKELQTRQCTNEELQAALVQLITIVNLNHDNLNKTLPTLQRKPWQATM